MLNSRPTVNLSRALCRSSSLWFRALSTSSGENSKCPFTAAAPTATTPSTAKPTQVRAAPTTPPSTSLKPLSSMPQLSGLSGLWSMMRSDPHKPFVGWQQMHDTANGELFYVDVLGLKMVLSFNPEHVPTLIRSAGPLPAPLQLLPWLFREKEKLKQNPKHEVNPIALEGQAWRANRTVLDAVFSNLSRIQSYLPTVDLIAEDFTSLLKQSLNPMTNEHPQLYRDMYGFSNEVIGQVVYGMRQGNLTLQERSPLAEEFGKDLTDLFTTMTQLQMSVPFYVYFKTPTYLHFTGLLDKFEQYYAPKFLEMSDKYHADNNISNENRNDLISHMREQGQNVDRILVNAVTMYLAGSDSTTHTLMWLLYNLGRFPHAQEALRQEVAATLPNKAPLNAEALNEMKYLRAVLKESMRLTPSVSGFFRVYDHPIAVGGYEVPPGVNVAYMSYTTNQKAEHFPSPDEFKPERWMEADRSKRPNPWLHVPFGSGPRACQAFRLAELEAYALMVKLVQHFKWETLNTVEQCNEIFIRPDREPQIKWTSL